MEQVDLTTTRTSLDSLPAADRVPTRALLWFWVVGALLQSVLLAAQEGLPFVYGLSASLPYYGLLALLAIPLWRLYAWSAEQAWPRWKVAALHIGAAVVVVALWQGVYYGVLFLMAGPVPIEEQLGEGGLWVVFQTLIIYALVAVGIVALQTRRRLRRQQARSSELRLLTREMEVRALRGQLRPHFLFNVLNSIYSLIASRPEQAQEMVAMLAAMMRATLDMSEEELIPLAEELELVQSYLQIEQIRLGSGLHVEWSLDPEAKQLEVPPFILQPLVENAIKHGVGGRSGPSRVAISTAVVGEQVEIRVVDDGPGPEASAGDEGGGRGLAITRSRLSALYGDRSRLEVAALEPTGFEARLVLPAR